MRLTFENPFSVISNQAQIRWHGQRDKLFFRAFAFESDLLVSFIGVVYTANP